MKKLNVFMAIFLFSYWTACSADVVDRLLAEYAAQTSVAFNSSKGKTLWTKSYTGNKDPLVRSCVMCHTENLAAVGKHVKTRKPIEPLAPSVNAKRLTDAKTIEKWFLRNCKWTMGRECTVEEKGHLLKFISAQ